MAAPDGSEVSFKVCTCSVQCLRGHCVRAYYCANACAASLQVCQGSGGHGVQPQAQGLVFCFWLVSHGQLGRHVWSVFPAMWLTMHLYASLCSRPQNGVACPSLSMRRSWYGRRDVSCFLLG